MTKDEIDELLNPSSNQSTWLYRANVRVIIQHLLKRIEALEKRAANAEASNAALGRRTLGQVWLD